MRELALDCDSSQPWKPHGTRLQLQLSRLLGGVEQSDRGEKAGSLYPSTGGTQDTAQRSVHRRRLGYPNTEGDKVRRLMGVGPQRASIRSASTAPHIVPPSASDLPSLCTGTFRLHSEQQCSHSFRSVNQCLPVRPPACKVEKIDTVVSLLVRIIFSLEPTDLRRLFSDVRTDRVLGAVLCPSCASWHIVEVHTRILDAPMFSERNLVRLRSGLATDTSSDFILSRLMFGALVPFALSYNIIDVTASF